MIDFFQNRCNIAYFIESLVRNFHIDIASKYNFPSLHSNQNKQNKTKLYVYCRGYIIQSVP